MPNELKCRTKYGFYGEHDDVLSLEQFLQLTHPQLKLTRICDNNRHGLIVETDKSWQDGYKHFNELTNKLRMAFFSKTPIQDYYVVYNPNNEKEFQYGYVIQSKSGGSKREYYANENNFARLLKSILEEDFNTKIEDVQDIGELIDRVYSMPFDDNKYILIHTVQKLEKID